MKNKNTLVFCQFVMVMALVGEIIWLIADLISGKVMEACIPMSLSIGQACLIFFMFVGNEEGEIDSLDLD
ncbi:hypothetical protein H7198_05430 [Fructobacillus sp. CRL 2054]|uniref:hypothetical protein n=1 Tax=Fructobacillus sp. CRL 2054 TaxID=2763007 RepID=UPI0023793490|nr:hypothetical protein [Fructobacillus sp. CRL 2054]MDD9139042.1 hypothetical protein [Fructobacillus sp. CRL 2054]